MKPPANENSCAIAASAMTRRVFMHMLGAAGTALAISPGGLVLSEAIPSGGRREIVSFHMDQPYLDRTGTAVPYNPPPGARSGEVVARLTEEAFRRSHVYA